MIYRSLGRHGLILPLLGLHLTAGSVQDVSRGQARERLAAASDAGLAYLQTRVAAEDSGAQQLLGELIRDLHQPRDHYILASQLGAARDPAAPPFRRGLSRKALREACEQSLQRLGTDYLDLALCEGEDPHTPLEETLAAMQQLVAQGKVLYWGLSGAAGERLAAMLSAATPGTGPTVWHQLSTMPVERPAPLAAARGLGQLLSLGADLDGAHLRALLADPGWSCVSLGLPDASALAAGLAALPAA